MGREVFSGLSPAFSPGTELEIGRDRSFSKPLRAEFRKLRTIIEEHNAPKMSYLSVGLFFSKDILTVETDARKGYRFVSDSDIETAFDDIGLIVDDGNYGNTGEFQFELSAPKIPNHTLPISGERIKVSNEKHSKFMMDQIHSSYPFYFLKDKRAPVIFWDRFSLFAPEPIRKIKAGETWERIYKVRSPVPILPSRQNGNRIWKHWMQVHRMRIRSYNGDGNGKESEVSGESIMTLKEV